jgi:hypothetical protein
MKRYLGIFAGAMLTTFLWAQAAAAFPGERMPYRAAHLAGKVAYKIDKHVIHPVAHGIDRRLR